MHKIKLLKKERQLCKYIGYTEEFSPFTTALYNHILITLQIRQFCKSYKFQSYLCTCMEFEIHPLTFIEMLAILRKCLSLVGSLSQKAEWLW